MANEKAASAPATDAGQDAPAGGKKKLIIIGCVVLALLVLGGVAGWLLLGGEDEAAGAEEVAAAPAPAIYASLGDKFVVTLQQGTRQRYFQVAVSAMAREQATIDELAVHAPLIRGRLLSLFGAQDFAALGTEEGKLALRAQILQTIQEILTQETGKPGVEQVFFTEFVLQ